jgi:UDPglucose 6-dehydrogenase
LWAQGCITQVYDPQASDALREAYPHQPLLKMMSSAVEATKGADAIALVTEWDEFWGQDFAEIAPNMRCAAMFDGRNIYDAEQMQSLGFRYFGVGRGERI